MQNFTQNVHFDQRTDRNVETDRQTTERERNQSGENREK